MNDPPDNSAVDTTQAFSKATTGHEPERATIYAGDIRQPWKSVYGFPITAARLAMGQGLALTCREDEVVVLMGKMNQLLKRSKDLKRAYEMVQNLQERSEQKLVRLITLRDQAITEDEISELVAEVVQLLEKPQLQTVTDRLACILSPQHPIQEIAGTVTMLARLQKYVAALQQTKDEGFQATVHDRRRTLMRPALEAQQNDPVEGNGQLPTYHLTLWTYLVARGVAGQSTVWN